MDLFCLPDRGVDLYGPELNRSTSGYSRTSEKERRRGKKYIYEALLLT
jgi:hypothetical protein